MTCTATVALLLAVQAPVTAARDRAALGQDPPPPLVIRVYDEAASRHAFAACDADADDRLSIFEACRAMPELGDPRDPTRFRRLDADADGFVGWHEFDARLQRLLRLRGELTVQPARNLPPPVPPPAADSPQQDAVELILGMADSDESKTLSRDELATLLASAGLPATLAQHFDTLDADRDGRLDGGEMALLAPLLPQLLGPARQLPSSQGFRPGWVRTDFDRDGLITSRELDRVLRRLEPELWRWAEKIVRDADRSGDGRLGAAEILRAEGERESRPATPRDDGSGRDRRR